MNQGAAFDVRNLDALKLAAKRSPKQGMTAAAKQMEGLFIQMMLKSMREASFKGGLFDNPQSQMFTTMYDQQISQDIAAQGKLGFANLIIHQMGGDDSSPAPAASQMSAPAELLPLPVTRSGTERDSALVQQIHTGTRPGNDSFISRMLAPAREVARLSGIPHQLIIAQAALESGWGNREIVTASGSPSHNLFGIKATPDWKGEATEVMTSEYTHGVLRKVKASFRVYKNYAEALSDYSRFLTANPRYQHVINNPSIENAAHALQQSGYATDPDYAKKLINIIRYVQNNLSKNAGYYKKSFDELF
ncbi:flagellar assembly peptidoglycan hydrolase FlgJ [Pantoea vagans]|uniref:flagellar assembly peptidoglycan hydrolase FlgJ n=1 Tax=Pantoea vagans TaxID=470934 RepID=UPI003FA3922A